MEEKKKDTKHKLLKALKLFAIACVLVLVFFAILMYTVVKKDASDSDYEGSQNGKTSKNSRTKIANGKIGPDFSDDMEHEPPASILVDISNADIFETGYYAYHFEVFSSSVAYINSNNEAESDIEWKVYISDKELIEEEIYALEDLKPAVVNMGEADLDNGQWIYILCNINAKTAQAASTSYLNITCLRDYA